MTSAIPNREEVLGALISDVRYGLAFFDAEGQLEIWNEAFASSFGQLGEVLNRGTSFANFIQAAVDGGMIPAAAGREDVFARDYVASYRAASGGADLMANCNGHWLLLRAQELGGGLTLLSGTELTDPPPSSSGLMARVWKPGDVQDWLRLLKRTVEATPVGVMITRADADMEVLYVNPAFENITGYAAGEIVGRNSRVLQGDDRDQPALVELRKALAKGEQYQGVLKNYRKDGIPFWNQVSIGPLYGDGGKVTHFVGIQEDITENRRVERQLRQALKMEAVGQLTGGVAHDFNNILAVIVAGLDIVLSSDDQPDEARSLISKAISAAERGQQLTDRLLSFSRQHHMLPKPTDIGQFASSMLDMLRRVLGETIEIKVETSPESSICKVDRGQLENAVLNLAINARDAMPNGGAMLIAVRNLAEPDGRSDELPPGRYVELSVADTGIGMDAEVIERAFEPFYTTKEVGKGSGLGLSMVYGFARQSGGLAAIESQPGVGTTLRLLLPRFEGEAVETADVREQPEPLAGQGQLILLVEDDPDVQLVMSGLVESLGYSVVVARDGKSALATLANNQAVDLVLSDVMLPGGRSGRDLAVTLHKERPDLPVILMSGYSPELLEESGQLHPGVRILQKPMRRAAVAEALLDALGKS